MLFILSQINANHIKNNVVLKFIDLRLRIVEYDSILEIKIGNKTCIYNKLR